MACGEAGRASDDTSYSWTVASFWTTRHESYWILNLMRRERRRSQTTTSRSDPKRDVRSSVSAGSPHSKGEVASLWNVPVPSVELFRQPGPQSRPTPQPTIRRRRRRGTAQPASCGLAQTGTAKMRGRTHTGALCGEPAAIPTLRTCGGMRAIGGSHGRLYLFVRLGVSGPNRSPALCQNCVRYPLKPRTNAVIYGDTPMHIVVAGSR